MSSDEEMPLRAVKRKSVGPGGGGGGGGPRAAVDSDDEVTLSQFRKRISDKRSGGGGGSSRVAEPRKTKTPNVISSVSRTKRSVSKAPARPRRASTDTSTGIATASGLLQKHHSQKAELIDKLLCRWWYAYQWPKEEDIIKPPEDYECLEGFPGVYICVAGDDIGKLLDNRKQEGVPSFSGFLSRNSTELAELLQLALVNQKEILVNRWGKGTAEEARIDVEMKWLKKFDPNTADRKASRILRKGGMA